MEVKNIRSWIYPGASEIYQLLSKCVEVQRLVGDRPVMVPTLVAREVHTTTFYMASALGFLVIDTRRQWAGKVEEGALLEVRNGLHFTDLHAGSEPSIRVRDRFLRSIPDVAHRVAATWAETANDDPTADLIRQMRKSSGQG